MSNVQVQRSITQETHQAGASVLLAVRLNDLERRAIGFHLSGRPIDAGNRAASQVLHREVHRAIQGLVMEYREAVQSDHATGTLLVSKETSGVWHVPKDGPERVANGWRCSILCDGREDTFEQLTVEAGIMALGNGPSAEDTASGSEERLCQKCARQFERDGES